MKVSNLIKEICNLAEFNCGVSTHINDNYSVGIYVDPLNDDGDYQVWLERPTQNDLDRGEVPFYLTRTKKVGENNIYFYSTGNSLVKALLSLKDKVTNQDIEY